ncbi:hypothetical protein HKK52_19530 [Pseudomonas sp. ADAK2]|uniref:hypothetical protein n=1 Tax=Pseudomonas TaxID=286 RepID=UPI0014630F41|nr:MULTISPECIES: hypothetical protein [Pseudomonas]QJI43043.1 hypothetical protein HKK53_19535 [Pseudomonas sp. ADAK7]QJI49346.1 hypothetical protein HKK52_19530 [Pseudomonas sp. ADAK2]WKL50892.1 hypothetical protein Q1W70_15420 [Pseudomonas kielensis]
MNKPLQNSASWSDTLKTRKAYLNTLLKTINAGAGKTSQIQTLTINAIKAEMAHIESQLNRRK